MKNIKQIFGISLLLIVIIGLGIYKYNSDENKLETGNNGRFSFSDGTYIINGQKIILVNGLSEVDVASSSSKIITRYFGNDIKHDLDENGTEDIIFILTQDTGGSGTFYYVVARLNTANGPKGSDAVLLGDRIAPQSTVVDENETVAGTKRQNVIVVNYAVRNPGEPMTTQPSLGKSIWLKLDPATMQFGEVAQNFEGETNQGEMTLDTKTWTWINTKYNDDKIITPLSTGTFTITFNKNGAFSAKTDCNSIGGEYSTINNKITFDKMMSTLMYCENSQESDFTKMLEQTDSFLFTQKGEMILLLKYDSGSVLFK